MDSPPALPPVIRALSDVDLPAARALWQETLDLGLSRTSDTLPALREFLVRNPSTCFGLWEGDRLIGTVLGGSDGRRGFVYHLAIHPERQRQALGRQLLDRQLAAFRALGIPKVHLFVFAENEQAVAFYRRLGWTERDDVVLFSLDL